MCVYIYIAWVCVFNDSLAKCCNVVILVLTAGSHADNIFRPLMSIEPTLVINSLLGFSKIVSQFN